MSKQASKKTGPATIVVLGAKQIEARAVEHWHGVHNTNTAFALDLASDIARENKKTAKADWRKLKAATVKVLTSDKVTAAVSEAGANVNTWRQQANRIACAAIAMLAYPRRKFIILDTNSKAKTTIAKAAAATGRAVLNEDGKRDPRASNAKRKTRKGSKAAKAKKAGNLRGPDAGKHPEAPQTCVIRAERFGNAAVDVARAAGEANALLAETSEPGELDPAMAHAALIKCTAATAKLLAELDRLRKRGGTRYELATGSDRDYAGLL